RGYPARVWTADGGKPTRTFVKFTARAVAFSPDAKVLAAVLGDKVFRWELDAPKKSRKLATLAGHSGIINTLAWGPGGHLIASGSDDASVRLWDAERGSQLHVLEAPARVQRLPWSPPAHPIPPPPPPNPTLLLHPPT